MVWHDGKRPDGMTLIPWKLGRSLVWDATCVDTLAASHIQGTSSMAGAAASSVELAKRRKYEDDEDNSQNAETVPTSSHRQADTTNMPGISGQPNTPVLVAPRKRVRTLLERDLFYSLLNNPPTSASEPTPGPSRPGTSSTEPNQSAHYTELPNLQHIIAIKSLSRGNNTNRNTQTKYLLHPVQRVSGSLRNSGSNSTIQADTSRAHRTGRIKRKSMLLARYGPAQFRNHATQSHRNPDAITPRSPTRSARSDSDFSDNETVSRRTSAATNEPNNDNVDQDQSRANTPDNIFQLVDNTSTDRVSETVNVTENADMEPANTSTNAVTMEDVVEEDVEQENQIGDVTNHAAVEGNEDVTEHAAGNQTSSESSRAVNREGAEENEPCTVKDFNQSLLRLLECPVCLDWMEPPMSQCRRGHLVCGVCRTRLSACPVCRTAFSSVRNRAMEGVSEMLRYPCRHGCGRETPLRRRASHEASCPTRRYLCPAPPCASRAPFPLPELSQHILTKHLPILKSGGKHKFLMKMNMARHDNWLVMVRRDLFHLQMEHDVRTWSVVVYVAYIGPKCNANNYTYEVSVVGQHNERKLVYSRVTHDDLESPSLSISRQDCFHLTLDQALNFLRYKNRHCETEKFLEITVEIKKLDVPIATPRHDSDS